MPVYTATIDRDRRDIDVAKEIANYVPSATPFTTILMKARKLPTATSEFHWYEQDQGAYWTKVDNVAGYNAAAVQIVVEDSGAFQKEDLIHVPATGEVLLITGINSPTDTLTVVRGFGTTAAAAIADEAWLVRMGNLSSENSRRPAERPNQPVKLTNYTTIVRTPFSQSATSAAESLRTIESERVRLQKLNSISHRMDIERRAMFGEPLDDFTNNRKTTGGLFYFITTNIKDASAGFTEQVFEEFCEQVFLSEGGSDTKLLIASPRVLTRINQFGTSKIDTRSGEKIYGMALTKYVSTHGTVLMAASKQLKNYYSGTALLLDMKNINYRPLRGRDTKLRTNIQDNDVDGWADEYLTEFGMQVKLERTHGILTGVA